jgi:hypothetical protein
MFLKNIKISDKALRQKFSIIPFSLLVISTIEFPDEDLKSDLTWHYLKKLM